jgi:hypothetical protein
MNYIAPQAFVRDEIYQIYTIFSLIWPECHVPEGSADKLQMGDMPGDCRIRFILVARNHVFFYRLASEGAM